VGSSFPSARKAEIYRFHPLTILLAPLTALVLQTYLPLYLSYVHILDLPLLVIIYFALVRRNAVAALLGGALIGMAQDSLTRGPIGLFGAVKTVTGYVTCSVGEHFDPENNGVRFLTIFVFYCLHFALYYLLGAVLLGQPVELAAGRRLLAALVNAGAGVLLFSLLDRFRRPA
jgi:rod shape-determining protein MreD